MIRLVASRALIVCFAASYLLLLAGQPQAAEIPEFAKQVKVRVDGALAPLDETVRKNAADARREQYRALRTANAQSAEGQLEIARWCRKQKMAEEEKLHWWTLLSMQPGHPEAIKGLGLRRYQGALLTAEEIEQSKRHQKEADQAEKTWMPKLKKLRRAIEHGDIDEREAALNELRAVRDPLALPSVEKVFGFDDVRFGRALVEMGGKIEGEEGANFLVQWALKGTDEYVRKEAAEGLRLRPYSTYAPALIARLAAPIDLSINVEVRKGGPIYSPVSWQEDDHLEPFFKVKRLRSQYTVSDVGMWVVAGTRRSGLMMTDYQLDRVQYNYVLSRDSPDPEKQFEYSGKVVAQEGTAKNQRKVQAKKRKQPTIEEIEKQVNEINEKQEALNARVHAALSAATGAQVVPADQFGTPKPQVWWDWWKKQTEPKDLLARGTEVWTDVGPAPIETVLVGDRVLTRDAKGELTFRLVISGQAKSESAVRSVEVDSRKIVAAPGQRFIVRGGEWKPASVLKDGMKVDGLSGQHSIQAVAEGQGAEAFALIVADVPTFFVDRVGVLVHDASR